MTPSSLFRTAFAVLSLVVASCAGETGEMTPVADLSTRLPLARVTREPTTVILGSAAAQPFRLSGFMRGRNRQQTDAPFIWSRGSSSLFRLPLIEARDLTLTLRVHPYRVPGGSRQTVEVLANGEPVDELELGWRVDSYEVAIPARHLRSGENEIRFRYGYSVVPRDVGLSDDDRELAVAWHEIRVEDAHPAGNEPAAPEEGVLSLPWGNRLDYYLDLAPDSVLEVGDWEWPANEPGRVEVTWTTDEFPERVLGVATDGAGFRRIELPGQGIARLGLRAIPGPEAGSGSVTLRQPIVRSPVLDEVIEEDPAAPRRPASPPNVVIYLVDTLRADRLGAYGHRAGVSPEIDAFAGEATLFENTVANSSWTRAAVASILTGLWPVEHGANRRTDRLSPDALTLAEILQSAGYRTAAFGSNANVGGAFGFRQGYQDFEILHSRDDAGRINELAFEWLERYGRDSPFFLYLHTIEPHDPYEPPEDLRRRFAPDVGADFAAGSNVVLKELRQGKREPTDEVIANLMALYDAEIAANDREFGRLVERLRELDLWDDTLFVFVSDHGEEFHEHGGWTHGRTLLAESVNVPLIIRFPGQTQGQRVATPVQQIDILPTVLEELGLERLDGLEGVGLRRIAAAEAEAGRDYRRIFSWLDLDQVHRTDSAVVSQRSGIVEGPWKLERDHASRRPAADARLYRWADDLAETTNLAGERPILAGYLRTLIEERLLDPGRRLEAEEAIIDEELEERLRALGYLP